MGKTLVVFYSRTGFTRQVAEVVARACDADMEEIRDVRSRRGPFGFLRSGYEASRRKCPAIRQTTHDPALYDLVIIGTPVWFGNVASPIRTYAMRHGDRLKTAAFFCTMGGQDSSKTLPELAQACGAEPLATIAISDKDITANQHQTMVEEFVRAISDTMPAVAA